ncbi:uncharacterized protein BKA78DRAFT_319544, partial [Phyllosticta capitalensis]|uniref:uncharacterized protein n=1 Tax=Phyllosticta capitalensis TaxID=121624 RepID=UPI003130FB70
SLLLSFYFFFFFVRGIATSRHFNMAFVCFCRCPVAVVSCINHSMYWCFTCVFCHVASRVHDVVGRVDLAQ